MDKIVDLKARVAANNPPVKEEPKGPDEDRVFEFTLANGDIIQGTGMLLANDSYFGTGALTPNKQGVDFTLAIPTSQILYARQVPKA